MQLVQSSAMIIEKSPRYEPTTSALHYITFSKVPYLLHHTLLYTWASYMVLTTLHGKGQLNWYRYKDAKEGGRQISFANCKSANLRTSFFLNLRTFRKMWQFVNL